MDDPVLHVIVVGFHHKKGCQVEFSYPPLIEGNSVESNEIPEEWKHIPSLALPDGAHNFLKDTVYFLLPGRSNTPQTVYAVSCYRQMDAKDLINKTADVTRSTVQKSVCVLSRLPLFGLIKAKLELITHAYFDEKDFSQVSLLEQTYKNLNSSLTRSLLEGTQVFLGLSARDLVATYKHKVIVLFKLLMLERRVLFFGSPVELLCPTLLGFLSLFPGMLENGLHQACNQWSDKKLSPTLAVVNFQPDLEENEQFLEVCYHETIPETPLSEVLGHLHNSGMNLTAGGDTNYTSLDINDEDIVKQNSSEAPEPLSIPRDSSFEKRSHRKTGSETTGSRSRSASSNDSDKLTVHAFNKAKRQFSVDESKLYSSKERDKYVFDNSPLVNMKNITQIEKVQMEDVKQGDYLTSDHKFIEVDDNSNAVDSGRKQHANSLTLHSTKIRQDTEEVIEDLDSPESISKIDKEDCFSWEQDHLHLSFDHDAAAQEANKPGTATPSSSMSESRDSISASDSGKESSVSEEILNVATTLEAGTNSSIVTIKKPVNESSPRAKSKALKDKLSSAFGKKKSKNKLGNENQNKHEGDVVLQQDQFGHPLAIFTRGSVCHPYLSLQYHDILTDVNIRSFVLGATNILFKQRRQLLDAFVEVTEGKVDIRDKELVKQLSLTTADLRFADYLVKTVTEDRPGLFLDGTEWEGSDEWVRAQFKHYLNSLLSTVLADDHKLLEDFGVSFLVAWKTTHNFRYWKEVEHPAIQDIAPGHPFQGNLSMADVRVRFNHTLQSTERGRKLNAAVVQTGKYVVQTGKAFGGAFTSAKSAVSGWFSSWRHNDKIQDVDQEPSHESDNLPVLSNETVASSSNGEVTT
uniref:UDENN domain-containing protein n=1 Tax=Biomphalaria glabrata TaxID=6526 RepID=A0A2C9M2W2_BIOGL